MSDLIMNLRNVDERNQERFSWIILYTETCEIAYIGLKKVYKNLRTAAIETWVAGTVMARQNSGSSIFIYQSKPSDLKGGLCGHSNAL